MRRGFSLVELLVVIAIIAILMAVFAPVFRAAQGAAFKYSASSALGQLGAATSMYAADNDDTYPVAFYPADNTHLQTWFGTQQDDGYYNADGGLIRPYIGGKKSLRDPLHQAKRYEGDMSGFGYNWGFIGSDVNVREDLSDYPYCYNPAHGTELSEPSRTIIFATSIFIHAPWDGGQGEAYDYGYIDPPKYWEGNPTVDFRHLVGGNRHIDDVNKQITSKGMAVVYFADGSVKSMAQKAVEDDMFYRNQSRYNPGVMATSPD